MTKRLWALLLLFLLGITTSAQARLGESEAQIVQRYGKARYILHRPWGDLEGFEINGFTITVTILNGASVGELYQLGPGLHITEEMEVQLLDANGEGYQWADLPADEWPKNAYPAIKGMWRRPNGSTAMLTDRAFEFKSIYLILAQEDAANRKPAPPTTQGF